MQRELSERPGVTGAELQSYAHTLLTCEPLDLREPARARTYAKLAEQLTNGENPRALDTLAQAYFETGDPVRAAEEESKALALLPPPKSANRHVGLRGEMESHLARFRSAAQH